MYKNLVFAGLFVAIITGIYLISTNRNKNLQTVIPSPTVVQVNEVTDTPATSEAIKSFTLADVEKHATDKDCWLAIEGKVYDVTKFIAGGLHPGGKAILQGCGKDATELFNTRPMGSGKPHSEKARSFLPSFYIGDLK